ncbi:MAG TPA: hypothetical protein VF698_05655, partial [Thermoanaerobaculia bacterium]
MEEETTEDLVPDRGTVRLWIVVLLPALTWAAHLQAAYAFVPTSCDAGHKTLLFLISLACFAVVAVNAIVAWRLWMSWPPMLEHAAAGGPEHHEPRWRGRSRFMAALAFAGSCLF